MPRVTGPMLSVDAAGTIAGLLTYFRYPGGTAARRRRRRRQPYTTHERSYHLLAKWLASQWFTLTIPQTMTWTDLAEQRRIANYHAFIGYNLQRWTRRKAPTKTYPAAETGAPGYLSASAQLTHRRTWEISRTHANIANAWGYFELYEIASTPQLTSSPAWCFATIQGSGTHYIPSPILPPASYRTRCWSFSNTGNISTPHGLRVINLPG